MLAEHEQAMAEAAAAVTASFFGTTAVAEPEVAEPVEATPVVEQPAVEPETVEAAPVATFDLNPELPEDIVAELQAAEVDEEVEVAVAEYVPQEDEYGNEVPVDAEEVRQRIKLEKENAHLRKQLVKTNESKWRKEAETFFPLAKHALDEIAAKATSRRGFLRAAESEHKRILPHVQTYLAEAKQYADAEATLAKDEARAGVQESWGEPLAGPDAALSAPAADREQRVNKARDRVREGKGTLASVFAEMMRGPKG